MNPMPFVRNVLMIAALSATASVSIAAPPSPTLAATLAATPPMGWNGWYQFLDKAGDAEVRSAADALVSTGMRDAGYVYLNLDDGWQGERDADGVLHPNARFPDMKALAAYIHAKGLKFGIYSSPGAKTCAGYAGSLGHEAQDAMMYARWGVDFVKYDLCSFADDQMKAAFPNDRRAQMRAMVAAYAKMRAAIDATGRPMVYSLCQYGLDAVWEWGARDDIRGNLWRSNGDVGWAGVSWPAVYLGASVQAGLARFAGPGRWNDPDILQVGLKVRDRELSMAENRAHFSLWAIMAAPLLAGNDLARMSPEIRAILTNRDVIAIDQDPLGRQGERVLSDGAMEVWTRPLADGGLALLVLNNSDGRYGDHPWFLDPEKIGLRGPLRGKDLWSGKTTTLDRSTPINLDMHDVLMLRIDEPAWADRPAAGAAPDGRR